MISNSYIMRKHTQNNSDTMELNQHFLSMEVVCVPLNWQELPS